MIVEALWDWPQDEYILKGIVNHLTTGQNIAEVKYRLLVGPACLFKLPI